MPLNNLPDLASMGDLPFNLYQAGTQQVKDVQKFNQEALKEQTLANLLSEQMNPLKVQNQELVNQGLGFDNDKKGVEARIGLSTENEAREAKRAELLKAATQNDLDRLIAEATNQTYSNDPAVRAIGQKKLDSGYAEILRRRKYEEDLAKQREELTSREKIAAGNNATSIEVANINQRGQNSRAEAKTKSNQTVLQQLAGAKSYDQSQNILTAGIQQAMKDGDVESATQYQNLLNALYQNRINEKQAGANAAAAPKIDVGTVANLPTVGNQSKGPAQVNKAPPAPAGKVAVRNPNGTLGFIPQSKLDAALKAGYTRAN